jgi:cysteine desulfurase
MNKNIYFDHAATTFVKQEVLNEMLPYFTKDFGNASTVYSLGQKCKMALTDARETVADALGCEENEIYFTASGSEADNWAIKGAAHALKNKGNHIITSAIEHHAVLHTCQSLEKEGFEVTYLPVDEFGLVSPEDVKNAIKDTTILITIMYANNEIGTIEPIKEIAAIAKEKGILMHTDAVQAVGAVPINVKEENVDMLSLSAHKFNGPKGVGALYIRKGVRIENLIDGGAQEKGKRAGTENLPGIVGLATALKIATESLNEKSAKLTKMRDYIIKEIEDKIPYCRLNGHRTKRLPNNVNFSFEFIEGEGLLLWLDINGIAASSGSACTSGSLDPSHVLLGIGLKHEIAHGSLRITLGEENTYEEADYMIEKLCEIVDRLRKMSPLYEEVKGDR